MAFFHSWCEYKLVCFLSPPMAYDLQLLRPPSVLQQCGTICSSSLCLCVRVYICVCVFLYIYMHNNRPLKFTFQVRCSVYTFTPPNMTLSRTIFTQRTYEFISLSCRALKTEWLFSTAWYMQSTGTKFDWLTYHTVRKFFRNVIPSVESYKFWIWFIDWPHNSRVVWPYIFLMK